MSNSFNMSDWRRRYVLMAENDMQFPKYDPAKHKTLMRGAIDYELQGDNIVAYLPFEEEDPNAVEYTFPKKQLEDYLGLDEEIMDDEELQSLDSDQVYRFFHDKYSGAFGSYWSTPRGQAMRAGKTEEDPFLKPMEETESLEEASESVDEAYYKILALIRTKAKSLSDDDAYALHERLKGFFNRLLEKEESAPAVEAKSEMLDLYERFLNKK